MKWIVTSLCVLSFITSAAFATEKDLICFEAEYYYPEEKVAERYTTFIPKEDNPRSDEDLIINVYIDVSESRDVQRFWRSLANSRNKQWVCARGILTQRQGFRTARLSKEIAMGFIAVEMWRVSYKQIPQDALVFDRY